MAAAYAAVVSLLHLMEQIQLYHARHPIFLDEQQRQLDTLHENVVFLQDFLESYSHGDFNKVENLDSRIADAAYAAEDIIETHIVDDVHARSRNPEADSSNRFSEGLQKLKDFIARGAKKIMENSSDNFSEGLQKTVEDVYLIKKEIAKIKEESKVTDQQSKDLAPVLGSLSRSPATKEVVMVFEDDLNQIMDKLTRNQSNFQIIPIIGMGGIGKTTLAKNVYINPYIVHHFDIRGWITISQQYDLREILLGLLHEIGDPTYQNELESLEYHQLGEKLYKYLSGRRYLIVMDDIWSITAWDKLRRFLPDNSNESRIIVTTRLSDVAGYFGSFDLHKMKLLDERNSWNLIWKKVFDQESCPPELEEVGKQIAKNCKGLPLSISIVGGLLANSKMKREYWEYVVSDTNAIANLEDDARCLKILSMSYNHLPVYLQPCFLYFGIFPEDRDIRVSKLIKLWAAEGFLKQSKSESMEEVAKNYLKNLIDRNLIFVSKWGSIGHMKYCKIHDLLRDLCLREAEKKKCLCVAMVQIHNVSQDLSGTRRIVIHHQLSDVEYAKKVSSALQPAPLARSLMCNFELVPHSKFIHPRSLPLNFRLLRLLYVGDEHPSKDIFQLVNTRYNTATVGIIPSSICLLWNLQTLIINIHAVHVTAPPEIWEMTQLRHLIIDTIELPDPPQNNCVLENLQTLSKVINLRLTEVILEKIPNVKKLILNYGNYDVSSLSWDIVLFGQLNNLGRLHKLQSLVFSFGWNEIKNLEFPLSLKKLTLSDVDLFWEDISTKVGSLPNLEKLKLMSLYLGKEWNPVDGQFLGLKYLEIRSCDLVSWRADETHFPCLEHLVLYGLEALEEIPSGIGDITTLQSIQLLECSSSAVASAKKILEEQREYGNENLRLLVDRKPVEKDCNDDEEEEEEEEKEEKTCDD